MRSENVREADAEIAADGARPQSAGRGTPQIDVRHSLVERLDIASFVEHEAGRRGIRKAVDQIAPADFFGLNAERGSGLVHQPLDREA